MVFCQPSTLRARQSALNQSQLDNTKHHTCTVMQSQPHIYYRLSIEVAGNILILHLPQSFSTSSCISCDLDPDPASHCSQQQGITSFPSSSLFILSKAYQALTALQTLFLLLIILHIPSYTLCDDLLTSGPCGRVMDVNTELNSRRPNF